MGATGCSVTAQINVSLDKGCPQEGCSLSVYDDEEVVMSKPVYPGASQEFRYPAEGLVLKPCEGGRHLIKAVYSCPAPQDEQRDPYVLTQSAAYSCSECEMNFPPPS